MPYINNFCFCSTIEEFLNLSEEIWLSSMEENYPFVTPYELSKEQREAWKDEYAVLRRALFQAVHKDRAYGKVYILFEYVLWDFDNENGVRPDVLFISRDRVGVVEFKTRSIDEDSFVYVTSQAKKYVHRLRHNHDRSRDMKVCAAAVMTSMKNFYQILGHVKFASPDRFSDLFASLLGVHPRPYERIYDWINSDYHFEKTIMKE